MAALEKSLSFSCTFPISLSCAIVDDNSSANRANRQMHLLCPLKELINLLAANLLIPRSRVFEKAHIEVCRPLHSSHILPTYCYAPNFGLRSKGPIFEHSFFARHKISRRAPRMRLCKISCSERRETVALSSCFALAGPRQACDALVSYRSQWNLKLTAFD